MEKGNFVNVVTDLGANVIIPRILLGFFEYKRRRTSNKNDKIFFNNVQHRLLVVE